MAEADRTKRICSVEGCERKFYCKGFCRMHYNRSLSGKPMSDPPQERGAALRRIAEVVSDPGDECVFWEFANVGGYGQVWVNGRLRLAHRVAYEMYSGVDIPDGLQARHLCGNGHLGCFNPRHIQPGTAKENNDDRIVHGTTNRGERHGLSRLTRQEVLEIRKLRDGGTSLEEIGAKFGIHVSTVCGICKGNRWSWLKEEA